MVNLVAEESFAKSNYRLLIIYNFSKEKTELTKKVSSKIRF